MISTHVTRKYNVRAQFDRAWKLVLKNYFKDFMTFLFPSIAERIDWQKPYEFLDKELLAIQGEAATQDKRADQLIKVQEINGDNIWVMLHIEIQNSCEINFAERMFQYYYRIYDLYRKPLMSMAILTDHNKKWRPNVFYQAQWGCELTLKFPTIKLLDFLKDKSRLEESTNPISRIILAHLIALETYRKPQLRFENKLKLVKDLYKLKYNNPESVAKSLLILYDFINYTMTLPNELQNKFKTELLNYEQEVNMNYMSFTEEEYLEKGKEMGMEKGMEKGERRLLALLLKQKFGVINDRYLACLEEATLPQIEQILTISLQASSIDEVFLKANKTSELSLS